MKRPLKQFTILASMSLLLVSCNEKISAELESGNSTTLPPVVTPTSYEFKLTNTSPVLRNYSLHRTGPSRFGTDKWKCGASTPYPFTEDLYTAEADLIAGVVDHDDKTYDISCFLEAEEQNLYYNGVQLALEVSPNTCDYVSYVPYSYYDRPAGRTEAHFTGIVCEEGVSSAALPAARPTDSAGNLLSCNQMVDDFTTVADPTLVTTKGIPQDFGELCRFKYLDKNCDAGAITFSFYKATMSEDTLGNPVVAFESFYVAPHYCGGEISACVSGPIRQESELDGSTRGEIVHETVRNQPFRLDIDLEAPRFRGGATNNYLANFRRTLANPHIDYVTTRETAPIHNQFYTIAYPDLLAKYDPNVMELFAANQTPDFQPIISSSGTDTMSAPEFEEEVYRKGYRAVPASADPFLAVEGMDRVNPFHTFYCLDSSQEIKSRIRLAIRDWDRVFPGNKQLFQNITDAHNQGLGSDDIRRMDVRADYSQGPGDPGYYLGFNDYKDWDDVIHMERTLGPGLPAYIYRPVPNTNYPAGFFNPSLFTK